MRLIIRSDDQQAGHYIADHIVARINAFRPCVEKRYYVLGLPTGSSPLPIYRRLVELYKAGTVSFKDVITFNMDEYVGIPRDHPASYHTFMYENFFSLVDIEPTNTNILDGEGPDLKAECEAYEAKIQAAGGIDLFLGGIGTDGHIAFNEPGSSFVSRTRPVILSQQTILANCRFFNDNLDLVPRQALTVGVQTIVDAEEVIIIATGFAKARAVRGMVEGGMSQMNSASALQGHADVVVVCDEIATEELRVKTVNYFKSIERAEQEILGRLDAEEIKQVNVGPSEVKSDSALQVNGESSHKINGNALHKVAPHET